jgi:uncharacterized protein (TIGR03083 family)
MSDGFTAATVAGGWKRHDGGWEGTRVGTVAAMDRTQFLEAIRRDGDALADAAEGNLHLPVASCPGWDVGDLVWHLGEVHYFWRTIAERRLTDPSKVEEPARPADHEVIAWFRAGVGHLLAVLDGLDPATPVWTWSPPHEIGFIVRRMAHETSVHRWDGDDAAGRRLPIEAGLASDGIDEFLAYFTIRRAGDAAPLAGSVHLHCTDVPGEWIVREGDDRTLAVERRHEKGDAAMRGSASDLVLALWRRVGLDALDIVGDRNVAQRLIDRQQLA